MSYSETSYQNWIQAQLEPEQNRLVSGKMKREPSALQAAWNNTKQMRQDLGEERFLQMEKEWKEWELNKYKEEHDL